jgi:hypothetical protein
MVKTFFWTLMEKLKRTGFYTTRFVEAQDAEQAEFIAVGLIKNDPKLSDIVLNKGGDSPC